MYLRMPNGYTLFFDAGLNYKERLDKIEQLVFNYNNHQWSKWIDKMWLVERTIGGKKIGVVSDLLDRLGTYLLRGNFRDGNILTRDKEESIRQTEIPASSTNGSDVEDHFYANYDTGYGSSHNSIVISHELTDGDVKKDVYALKHKEIEKNEKDINKKKEKWKNTKTNKLNQLYSTEPIQTYRVIATKNKDFKGKPIIDIEYVTIGGHKGILGDIYVGKWCLVNTENEFEFLGNNYKINSGVKQYRVDSNNKCEMERILMLLFTRK